ncbi:glycosyltransferase family 4 protein [Endozoicomonas atrinae]|uniref:glycosyltransferase family 4 protein n=1 Tax=Endozoicomonas atrinae TaxID=1333660 RepID=UPI000825D68D|nr:glycosyltransferase family 4 protein [Endozoicomonas atrinae]
MKILYLVTEDWYFTSHRLNLAIQAKKNNSNVVVVCNVSGHSKLIESTGARVISLKHWDRTGINPLSEIKAIFEIIKIYHKEKPDIVHHIAQKPVLYGSIAALFSNINVKVNAVAGMGFVFSSDSCKARLLRPFFQFFYSLLFRRNRTALIVQNEDDQAFFVTNKLVSTNKVSLIRGAGIDVDEFYPVEEPSGVVVIALVARMLSSKGVPEAIQAARLLKQQGVDFRLDLVGDPDLLNPESVTEAELRAWHDEGVVNWVGRQTDIAKVWQNSHIALLPSHREGTPKSLLEAAASGRPMVTTDVPGCRQLVINGVTGLMVPRESPADLAVALKRLIEDQELRVSMGIAARSDMLKRYSSEIVTKKTFELYDSLLAS